MAEKKKPPALPLTPETAEAETTALWADYRAAHDQGASPAEIEALRKRVSSALSRVKKQAELSMTKQRLQDLATYVKRLAPKPADPQRATAVELERETTSLEAQARCPPVAPALLPRVTRLLQIIEEERGRDPEDDEDHDRFVSVEERLWDLKNALEHK